MTSFHRLKTNKPQLKQCSHHARKIKTSSFEWRHSSPILNYAVKQEKAWFYGKRASEFFFWFENIFKCYRHQHNKNPVDHSDTLRMKQKTLIPYFERPKLEKFSFKEETKTLKSMNRLTVFHFCDTGSSKASRVENIFLLAGHLHVCTAMLVETQFSYNTCRYPV